MAQKPQQIKVTAKPIANPAKAKNEKQNSKADEGSKAHREKRERSSTCSPEDERALKKPRTTGPWSDLEGTVISFSAIRQTLNMLLGRLRTDARHGQSHSEPPRRMGHHGRISLDEIWLSGNDPMERRDDQCKSSAAAQIMQVSDTYLKGAEVAFGRIGVWGIF